MKQWIGLALLVFVGTAGWRIGNALSPDALSMAVGVLFGVMAGVPTSILIMASSRRRNVEEASTRDRQAASMQHYFPQHAQQYMPQQPPIIVVAGPPGFGNALQPAPAHSGWLPQERPARHFTVVGEREEVLEDW